MAEIDYSLPLSTILQESTHEAHELVAKSPNAILMLSGELKRDEYIRYLMMLWHIYDNLEKALERHASYPTLEPTYNPTLLSRAAAISADISYLLQVPESEWPEHPMHVVLRGAMPAPLCAYVTRIRSLADAPDPTPLLAHSYVRYLGDLSGGQTIRHTLAKAYDLDEAAGLGVAFYAFKELKSQKAASQGEMKRIKDWFREGINAAGNRGSDVKAAVVREANTAFDLNTSLFTAIRKGPPRNTKASQWKAPVVVEEKGYSIAQVVSVIVAICLAHFLLVVAGFTGDPGYQKLLNFEQWMTSTSD